MFETVPPPEQLTIGYVEGAPSKFLVLSAVPHPSKNTGEYPSQLASQADLRYFPRLP